MRSHLSRFAEQLLLVFPLSFFYFFLLQVAFLAEANIMKAFSKPWHHNVTRLLGVVTSVRTNERMKMKRMKENEREREKWERIEPELKL